MLMKPIAKKTLWAARNGSGSLYAYNQKPHLTVTTTTSYNQDCEMPQIKCYSTWSARDAYIPLPDEWLPELTPATAPVKISLELWMEEDNSDE